MCCGSLENRESFSPVYPGRYSRRFQKVIILPSLSKRGRGVNRQSGGIGRRAGLKIQCSQECAGSSPASGTGWISYVLRRSRKIYKHITAEVVKLVDTHVSGACVREDMRVRVSPSARSVQMELQTQLHFFYLKITGVHGVFAGLAPQSCLQVVIAQFALYGLASRHPPEELLLKLPEEPELSENKSVKQQEGIIDREDEDPICDRKPGRLFICKKPSRDHRLEEHDSKTCAGKNNQHNDHLPHTVQVPALLEFGNPLRG